MDTLSVVFYCKIAFLFKLVKPTIQAVSRIPVCLRKELKQDLERLEKEGIII